jgi:hypothetical protein
MERKVLYEDQNLKLEYVSEGNYIHETWWGITSKEVFEKLLYRIIEFMKETKSTGLLLDAREHKGLGPESQNLAAKEIGNLAEKTGGLREAIVVPKDVFSSFSVKNYADNLKNEVNSVETVFFESLDKAEDWLKKQ